MLWSSLHGGACSTRQTLPGPSAHATCWLAGLSRGRGSIGEGPRCVQWEPRGLLHQVFEGPEAPFRNTACAWSSSHLCNVDDHSSCDHQQPSRLGCLTHALVRNVTQMALEHASEFWTSQALWWTGTEPRGTHRRCIFRHVWAWCKFWCCTACTLVCTLVYTLTSTSIRHFNLTCAASSLLHSPRLLPA